MRGRSVTLSRARYRKVEAIEAIGLQPVDLLGEHGQTFPRAKRWLEEVVREIESKSKIKIKSKIKSKSKVKKQSKSKRANREARGA